MRDAFNDALGFCKRSDNDDNLSRTMLDSERAIGKRHILWERLVEDAFDTQAGWTQEVRPELS